MPDARLQAPVFRLQASVFQAPIYKTLVYKASGHQAPVYRQGPERESPICAPLATNLAGQEEKIIDYYRSATTGYRDWSRNINMHFGVYEWGINPFNLEAMLENTNRLVLNALQLQGKENHLLDMGCGVGATARFCAAQDAVGTVTGITLVDTQIDEARQLSVDFPFARRLRFQQANYHCTAFADSSFEGIYAIESACHSTEIDKHSLLKEAMRLLKPGSRLVICDGFIKTRKPLNPLLAYCYRKTCEYWSLGNFAEINTLVAEMQALGYRDISVRNISLRIAPSALFIPWVSFRFFLRLLWSRDKNQQHWNHLLAPLYSIPLAFSVNRFGYYLVTGTK